MPVILMNLFYFAVLGAILYFFVYKRLKFKNWKSGGPFFFENGCLVLNTGVLYPVPLAEIDRVELHYDRREIESRITYHMWVWVVRKSGGTKKVYYTGSTTATTPDGWRARLEERDLQVVMVDGRARRTEK